mmetsp:Transcript_74538/g.198001  ORF Transcript_74538/g.198001 Transcript_74538/m.198001 type:complete len:320 (-) Transcript_74538:47-1006(-)
MAMQQGRRPPPSIPADLQIDEDARYSGTVINYYKWQGYGFIQVDQPGVVPNEKLWVHWSSIQTNDRYPFLVQGQKVEFGVMTWVDHWSKATTLRAKTVTAEGGIPVSVQDALDAEKKTFVGQQELRYTGVLKFYSPKKGFGYVVMDDGFVLPEQVPKELRVDEHEMNCAGKRPQIYIENLQVEFGIVKTRGGKCMAYNMTLPGGLPMLRENLEHRQDTGPQVYNGTVSFYNWKRGWGLIAPDPEVMLPPRIQMELEQMQRVALEKSKSQKAEKAFYFAKDDIEKGLWPKQGMRVTFRVYADDKGVGACDVNSCETPEEA